jgi:MFS family permease
VFLLNGLSFIGVLTVIYHWQRPAQQSLLPAERLWGAMRAGLRYARHAPALRTVLVRAIVFVFCASGVWALLPLVGRQELGLTSIGYGLLLGCLGLGAVSGAAILPQLRRRFAVDLIVAGSTLIWSGVAVALAYVRNVAALGVIVYVGGMAWMGFMSTMNAAAQTAVPSWVRARALSMFSLTFMGGIAAGSTVWGTIAAYAGIPLALVSAAVGMCVGLLTMLRYRLAASVTVDVTPSKHWPAPFVAFEPELNRGPVLVTVEYLVDPLKAAGFAQAMRSLRLVRRRDGAVLWGLFQDAADPQRWMETFVVESWVEHLRQHERFTAEDRKVESRVREFHTGEAPPAVKHLIAPDWNGSGGAGSRLPHIKQRILRFPWT